MTALVNFNHTLWASDLTQACQGLAEEVSGSYPRTISGTTGTLLDSDNGHGVQCTNAGAVTLTIPAGLGPFTCYVIQSGAGTVTLAAASGVTLTNRQSHTGTAGQYAVISLITTAANVFVLAGDTA